MKLSVSLPEDDIVFLDASELGTAHEDAWDDWSVTEAGAWEQTVADGLGGY